MANVSARPYTGSVRLAILALLALAGGCLSRADSTTDVELVWGRRGISDGRLQKPRAIAIDRDDRLYIVDMTARIQVFDRDGQFLSGWSTPEHEHGRPTGLSIASGGEVLVADTHYYRVLVYSAQGKLLRTVGGTPGHGPGQFGLVTSAVQDRRGDYYVAEYGDHDRIQKFNSDWQFLRQWGSHGAEPGQFIRPQKIVFDAEDRLWVADAGNHRIQVFDRDGKLLFFWGTQGDAPGQLYYPYDLVVCDDQTLYVCEFGNNRVQRFTPDGRSLGCWGGGGRGPGQLNNPWGVVRDTRARLHVLDTNNHRVQRIHL